MRLLNANIVFVMKCFKKANNSLVGSICDLHIQNLGENDKIRGASQIF